MANDPNDPRGPGTPQNPNPNPNLTDTLNQLDSEAVKLAQIEQHLKRISERGDDISKRFRNVNLELTTAVDLADKTEEAVKEIADAAKSMRKGILDSRQAKDAYAAVKAIRDAQEILLKRTKEMPQQQAKVIRGMREMDHWMNQLKDATGELADDQMRDLQRALHQINKDAEQTAKTFKSISVGHLTRQMVGITGAMKEFGIGKSFAAKVEKYAGYADVAAKIKDAQRARFEANKDVYKGKREAAIAAVGKKYGIDMADPRALRMAGKGKREAAQADLANIFGTSAKKLSQADLIGLAGGKGTEKSMALEATLPGIAKHGGGGVGGAASMLATGVENGLTSISTMLGRFAPIIGAIEYSIGILIQVFDGWTEQNKKIEAAMGKGGLFTAGAGAGFGAARRGLTPDVAYDLMGASFDRNLKIAGAIASAGLDVQDIVRAGQEEELGGKAAYGRGPAGAGFMAGGTGLIQRAVMGAGRMAGLTDEEGVQRVIKLLEDYRETLESGENFFIQVGKGAKAAGISTTKYISIIDDVLQRFDKMNRSLDSTVAVLGSLSKTGRIASSDLEQYFKFLTGGMGAQEAAGTSEQIFLLKNMGGRQRGEIVQQQKDMMTNLINRAAGVGGRAGELGNIPGLNAEMIRKGFGGSAAQMTEFIRNVAQPAIDKSGVDDKIKKGWTGLLDQMREQKQQSELWDDFAKGKIDAVGMGQAMKMQGMNMSSSLGLQATAMNFILRGGSLKEFAINPGEFAGRHKETAFLADMFKTNPLLAKTMIRTQELASGLRISDAQQAEQPESDKELYQLALKHGFKIDLKHPSAYKKWLIENGDKLRDDVANLRSTTGYWGKASVKAQEESSDAEKEAAREQAKSVAMQTRGTADIFADAFAKWFNNLIEGIEAILDVISPGKAAERRNLQEQAKTLLRPSMENAKMFQDTQAAMEEWGKKAVAEGEIATELEKQGRKDQAKAARVAEKTYAFNQQFMQTAMSSGQFFSQSQLDEFQGYRGMAFKGASAAQLTQSAEALKKQGATHITTNVTVGVSDQTTVVPPTGRSSNEVSSSPAPEVKVKTKQ